MVVGGMLLFAFRKLFQHPLRVTGGAESRCFPAPCGAVRKEETVAQVARVLVWLEDKASKLDYVDGVLLLDAETHSKRRSYDMRQTLSAQPRRARC